MSQDQIVEPMPEQREIEYAEIDPLERFSDRELLLYVARGGHVQQTVAVSDPAPSDRELIQHLVNKVAQFEQLITDMGEAADKNPMLKMMLGKFLK